jgi:hypothetical protein
VSLKKAVRRSDSLNEIGRLFRIGYYSRIDGLDYIWLIDENGDYAQTLDHAFLHSNFSIMSLSKERSLYGRGRPPFGKFPSK